MNAPSHTPLVSVMMPAFNVEAFLPAALDSLIKQTYQNWEAVVVDDGSSDGTAMVLREYASKDGRIKPVYAEHGGRGKARNLALEHCNGDFVALLDADDVAVSDRFMKQVDFLTRHSDFGVISGQCISFVGEPQFDRRKLMPWPTDPEEIQASLLSGRMRILNGGSMIRRSVFAKHGGYRVDLLRAQDYEFFRRIAKRGVRMGALNDVVLLYRQERSIPSLRYYVESEAFKAYADALHDGYTDNFATFKDSKQGRRREFLTRLRYGYLFIKLFLRYRGL